MNLKPFIGAAALAVTVSLHTSAQGTQAEFDNALSVMDRWGAKNVYHSDVKPVWLSPTTFWYSTNTADGTAYTLVDANRRSRRNLFDKAKLADALAKASGAKVDAKSPAIANIRVNAAADTLRFEFVGKKWAYAIAKNRIASEGAVVAPPPAPHWMVVDEEKQTWTVPSPDGTHEAFIRENNVWVRNLSDRSERALTTNGTISRYYSAMLQWSPDGKYIATTKIRPIEKRYVYYVESSPADQLQPKLHKQEYAKPGDEMIFKVPVIVEVATGKSVTAPDAALEPQFRLTELRWDSDSKGITFEQNERGHKRYAIMSMDAATGALAPVVDERADTYVQYDRAWRHHFADGRRVLWFSERDNHGHLYLYDRANPDAKPLQVTSGDFYVRNVLKVDEQAGKIYFSANGVAANEDPYNIKYYSINLDGSDMSTLTPDAGTHSAWLAPGERFIVDVVSGPASAPVATLRSATDGSLVMPLETADISKIVANGWTAPEVFCAPGRDGKTPIWGIIQRPSNFDPNKTYPVIEYIYQGPHDHFVPKNFLPVNYWTQTMAELGFVVVMVDGMSTAYRSRDFENVCYKNLNDAGLPDHMAWMRAAAAKYPYMDLSRVGIYGCSAGGQESLSAILQYPDFYKACYSACGCHDNRMDKTWWNELWMGYPVDESYVTNSNVTNAHKLQGALMLVVGELDDNVDPATTMQVANALIKANKDFELVVIPGAHHTMGERYGDRKRFDFFVKNLMGVTPPKWK